MNYFELEYENFKLQIGIINKIFCDNNQENKFILKFKSIISANKSILLKKSEMINSVCKFDAYEIKSINSNSICLNRSKLNCEQNQLLKSILEEYLIKDRIQFSESIWSSPVYPKINKNGKKKLKLDYYYLNGHTQAFETEFYEKSIDEILINLPRSNIYSLIIIKDGSYQIELARNSRYFTAFETEFGKFEFKKMCPNLWNSKRLIQHILGNFVLNGRSNYEINAELNINNEILSNSIKIYKNKLLIHCFNNLDQHLDILSVVLLRLKRINLKIDVEESIFLTNELIMNGRTINLKGVKMNNKSVYDIIYFKRPETANQLKEFCNLVHKFKSYLNINNDQIRFLEMAFIAFDYLINNDNLIWNNNFQDYFDTIKGLFVNFRKRYLVNFDKRENEIILQSNKLNDSIELKRELQKTEQQDLELYLNKIQQSKNHKENQLIQQIEKEFEDKKQDSLSKLLKKGNQKNLNETSFERQKNYQQQINRYNSQISHQMQLNNLNQQNLFQNLFSEQSRRPQVIHQIPQQMSQQQVSLNRMSHQILQMSPHLILQNQIPQQQILQQQLLQHQILRYQMPHYRLSQQMSQQMSQPQIFQYQTSQQILSQFHQKANQIFQQNQQLQNQQLRNQQSQNQQLRTQQLQNQLNYQILNQQQKDDLNLKKKIK